MKFIFTFDNHELLKEPVCNPFTYLSESSRGGLDRWGVCQIQVEGYKYGKNSE